MILLCTNISFSQNRVIDSLLSGLKIAKEDTEKINILNVISDKFTRGKPDSAIFYARQALVLSTRINYQLGEADAYLNIGWANTNSHNFSASLKNLTNAQNIYKQLLSPENANRKIIQKQLATSYHYTGWTYLGEAFYSKALQQFFNALQILEETNNSSTIAPLFNSIGNVYFFQHDNSKALEYYNKSLNISNKNNDKRGQATSLNGIGTVYTNKLNYEKGLKYFLRSLRLNRELGDNDKIAVSILNIGDCYFDQGQYNKALEYYLEGLKISREIKDDFLVSGSSTGIGNVYFKQKKFKEALSYQDSALQLGKKIGSFKLIRLAEESLSKIYEQMHDGVNALDHYKKYIIARDSSFNTENAKKIVRVEMNYEFEKKQALEKAEQDKKEALYLESAKRQKQLSTFLISGVLLFSGLVFVIYNRWQVKRRLTLQKDLVEYEQKALHLQMNPHFVFNCLGSISSFIAQNGTDSAIRYLAKFSKLMRLTLEYSKASLIPIDKEMESLQNYLELEQLRFNDKFDFEIKKSALVEDDMALPPLLIQPFVENAILHGIVPKPGKGRIEVHFNIENDNLICLIVDNGIGLEKSKEAKEGSVTMHKSMALEITKKRLEIMESVTSMSANVRMEDMMDKNNELSGTKVMINLPVQFISDIKIRV